MSGTFFKELGIPEPDVNLNVGSGTQAEQTSGIMIGYEKLLMQQKPDLCIVVGDVTSTMACAIVARKMLVPVAHVEGGIRSGDMTMPEEINRIVTDSITDYFFTTSETANDNLRKSGVTDDRIFFVGNTMIDTLLASRDRFKKPKIWDTLHLKEKEYLVLTLHRPNNVDEEQNLKKLLDEIINSSNGLPLIFPVHPRTAKIINSFNPSLHQPFDSFTPSYRSPRLPRIQLPCRKKQSRHYRLRRHHRRDHRHGRSLHDLEEQHRAA